MTSIKNTVIDRVGSFLYQFPDVLKKNYKDKVSESMRKIIELSKEEDLPEEDTNPFYKKKIKISDTLLDIRNLFFKTYNGAYDLVECECEEEKSEKRAKKIKAKLKSDYLSLKEKLEFVRKHPENVSEFFNNTAFFFGNDYWKTLVVNYIKYYERTPSVPLEGYDGIPANEDDATFHEPRYIGEFEPTVTQENIDGKLMFPETLEYFFESMFDREVILAIDRELEKCTDEEARYNLISYKCETLASDFFVMGWYLGVDFFGRKDLLSPESYPDTLVMNFSGYDEESYYKLKSAFFKKKRDEGARVWLNSKSEYDIKIAAIFLSSITPFLSSDYVWSNIDLKKMGSDNSRLILQSGKQTPLQ